MYKTDDNSESKYFYFYRDDHKVSCNLLFLKRWFCQQQNNLNPYPITYKFFELKKNGRLNYLIGRIHWAWRFSVGKLCKKSLPTTELANTELANIELAKIELADDRTCWNRVTVSWVSASTVLAINLVKLVIGKVGFGKLSFGTFFDKFVIRET